LKIEEETSDLPLFDSSALVKLFILEAGTAEMIRFYEPLSSPEKFISELASIEVRSAIRRRERANHFSADEAELLLRSLESELAAARIIPVNRAIFQKAHAAIDRHKLKSLDSIQLASALDLR
jgi:predicted nucleic acid-binding protein